MSHIANLRLPLDKQHTCAACGCVFRYTVHKTVAATGMTQARAEANLQALARQQVQGWQADPASLVETHPCPSCGLIQPEMVGWTRISHAIACGLAVVYLLFFAASNGEWKESASPTLSELALVGVGLFAVLAGPTSTPCSAAPAATARPTANRPSRRWRWGR
jgi:hypothetical protein